MRSTPEGRAMFGAIAVAYLAKGRFLDPAGVDRLEAQVADLLPDGGDIRDCVEEFAAAYRHVMRDPAAVAQLGDRLAEKIGRLARPDPPGMGRADLNG